MNSKSRPLGRYILLGVASMAAEEFQANVLLRGSLLNFLLAMGVVYAPLSAIAWWIDKRVTSPQADLWFYAIGGLFGMLFIEWYCIGFYPGSGKPGIQAAMFANWAAVFTIPRLFTAGPTEEILLVRRKVKETMINYSVGAPLLVLLLPIPKGGTVAILMSVYSIRLSFQYAPFLVQSERGRKIFKRFNIGLAVATVINVLCWGK